MNQHNGQREVALPPQPHAMGPALGRLLGALRTAGGAPAYWQRWLHAARGLRSDASAIADSGLFDLYHYVSCAGMPPNPELCIRHYLRRGSRTGLNPHRLFDAAAYVAQNPDVARAGVDPFVHFIRHGIREGRQNTVPADFIAAIQSLPRAALESARVLKQAAELGWNAHSPSLWQQAAVAVYASSLGNFFMRQIADRIADALRGDGVRVYRLDQNSQRPADTTIDIVVAPHEFFHLGGGVRWLRDPAMARAIMLNTEQPGTKWFFLALMYAPATATLVDMSPQSAVVLRDLGRMRSGYLPLGWVRHVARPGAASAHRAPAPVRGLETLADVVWHHDADRAWEERPIDVLFIGTLTPRRARALARLAPTLAPYRCFIHAPTGAGRPLPGAKSDLGVRESWALATRSKIMLNLHRDELPYLEWHRMMTMGVEAGALVLSEPCLPAPAVEPQRHFLAATLPDMPALINRVLTTAEGKQLGDAVRSAASAELPPQFDLERELRALAFLHETNFASND